MLAIIKQKWKENIDVHITAEQKMTLLLLVLLYFALVLFSAIPSVSVIIARNIAAQLDQETISKAIQSMCRRTLWVSTVGVGMVGMFLLGRLGCNAIVRWRTRIIEWQNNLLEGQKEYRFRYVLVRHFVILHNADMFMLSWCAVFAAQFFLCLHGVTALAWLLIVFPFFVLGAEMQSGKARPTRWYTKLSNLTMAAFLMLCQGLLIRQFEALHEFYLAGNMQTAVLQFFLMLLLGLTVLALVLAFCQTEEKVERRAHNVLRIVVISMVLYFVLDVLLKTLINEFDLSQIITYITTDMFSALNGLNLFLTVLFVMTVTVISSVPLGSTLLILLYAILLIGNVIKIKFQGSLLTPIDFAVISELFSIAPKYIGRTGVVLLLCILIVALGCIIWQIKRIGKFLCPHPSISMSVLIFPVLIVFAMNLQSGKYTDVVYQHAAWLPPYTYLRVTGPTVYNFYNILDIPKIFPSKPNGYSEKTMKQLSEEFDQYATGTVSDIKPDVVLIMAESLFDVTRLNGVSFNKDITQTIRNNQVGTIISPRYGGGTAGVEFEGITGFSNLFLVNEMIAYTAYFNDSTKSVPSLASEFKNAGYETTAVHLNDGAFYNRETAYKMLGFDDFLSLQDIPMGTEQKCADGFVQDQYFFDVLRSQLETGDNRPQFIFGVSIEGHNPYDAKYDATEIRVNGDGLSEEAVHQLEQYGQAVYNFDQDLKTFIDYLETRERPTIVYIWGDHLPFLAASSETGYIDSSVYAKYETPFIAYSNYKAISVDSEYMTPNQITPQILRDTEIEYNSFYDYVYSLREDYPIAHHDYTTDISDDRLQKYWLAQYDLMFGKQYLTDP